MNLGYLGLNEGKKMKIWQNFAEEWRNLKGEKSEKGQADLHPFYHERTWKIENGAIIISLCRSSARGCCFDGTSCMKAYTKMVQHSIQIIQSQPIYLPSCYWRRIL